MARKRDVHSKLLEVGNGHSLFTDIELESVSSVLPNVNPEKMTYLRSSLPILCNRYLAHRSSESGTGLRERRRKLDRIAHDAEKLRARLLNIEGAARLDMLATASSLVGKSFHVNATQPHNWLTEDAQTIVRDIHVIANKSSRQLKKLSVRGGRPKHNAERILIWDLADLYYHCTEKMPGYRGYFPKFIFAVFQKLDPHRPNEGLNDLTKEIVNQYKSEFDENH